MTGCSGWVRSLKGKHVTFTGLVHLGGDRVTHRECGALVESRGGSWAEDFSSEIDLVVRGWQGTIDYEKTGASRKLALARQSNIEQSEQPHVHVVHGAGFSDLLEHHSAECINQPLEGRSGDRVRAMTADGQRKRIEGRLEIVVDDSDDYVLPTVVLRKKSYEVFPSSVHVLEQGSSTATSTELHLFAELQDAAAKNLIRTFRNGWAPRYDITWEEMFAQLEILVEPLQAVGWKQNEISLEKGSWDDDDFVFASLVRNDIAVDIEVGKSGWVSGWEELLLEERSDEDVERTEFTNPRIVPGIGKAHDLKGVSRRYRRERWLP
jgi:hypothetical protein